ncbi:MAG: GTPase domain-containing protein [Tepidisphaeraceae bacterium]|jgi:GTPase Era involved in 16S rRNA processing
MNVPSIEQLVQETIALTGSPAPPMLQDDWPVLRQPRIEEPMYLVGLIGGKDVGKSAMVNALVGEKITEESSYGPGTQDVVAYVHQSCQAAAAQLLEREVPGRYRIVTHDQQRLSHQALLDLPDIDSRFADHLQITCKMLRHMLFPVWMQSVEKYADARPQQLLAKVASGNDPKNFLFCLNKVDQLPAGGAVAPELQEDYARRVASVLSLSTPPRVFMVSAIRPADFDLPELARQLRREKSPQTVAESRQLADRRRQRSLLAWLDEQDLPGRAQRLNRLDQAAGELLAERLGEPIVETATGAMLDDPAYLRLMSDGLFSRRVARWPIVNVLHAALLPLRLVAGGGPSAGAEALVDAHLPSGKVATLIQSAFAQLHQSDPAVASLFGGRKLWDRMDAEAAEGRLRLELIETIHHQRQAILSKYSGKSAIFAPAMRLVLTLGALLWFPLIQPIVQTLLTASSPLKTLRDAAILLVQLLSTTALLKNAVFLLLWYLLLWSLLRWHTRRRVEKLLWRWRTAPDASLNLTACALQWMDELLEKIHAAARSAAELAQNVKLVRDELEER